MERKDKNDIFMELRSNLNEGFDMDKISVSDALIQKTLKAIDINDSPHVSEEIEREKRKRIVRLGRRTAVMAACFLILAVGIKLFDMAGIMGHKESSLKSDKVSMQEKNAETSESVADRTFSREAAELNDSTDSGTAMGKKTDETVCKIPIQEVTKVIISKDGASDVTFKNEESKLMKQCYEIFEDYDWKQSVGALDTGDWDYKISFYGKEDAVCSYTISKNGIEVENVSKEERTVVIYLPGEYTVLTEKLEKIYKEERR